MERHIWHGFGDLVKTSLREATGEYRRVAGADGVVGPDFRANGAPEGAE